MAFLKAYTKNIVPGTYDAPLAHSVHFAVSADGVQYTELNHGYGMLFARGSITKDNTIEEMGCTQPKITFDSASGTYLIYAQQITHDGAPTGLTEVWRTPDFLHFTEETSEGSGASETSEAPKYPGTSEAPVTSEAPGTSQASVIEIPESLYQALSDYFRPVNTGENPARWPLSVGYADPVLFKHRDAWYFLATNDNRNDIALYLRRSETLRGLFQNADGSYPMDALPDTASESIILDYDEEHGFCQTFWAPEFHIIGGVPCILFAVSGRAWGPQCHIMRLKEGGDLMNPADWELPIRVQRKDGSFLTTDGITLDMTYLRCKSGSYVVWSYRYGINSPRDTGSMLYIATVNEKEPWKLTSEPVLLSRPLFGFENVAGTINNEGPYALVHDGRVYLAYSGGAACGYYYTVNYLIAGEKADLLDTASWQKLPTAQLSSASMEGIIGPGHNSFFTDDAGNCCVAYHVQDTDRFRKRCTTYHKVEFTKEGFPRLDRATSLRLY